MPVNFPVPETKSLHPVAGMRLGVARAGIRKAGRKDLLVIALDQNTSVAGVFTRNRFRAAPVSIAIEHMRKSAPRALVINTGCANAGTGQEGLSRATQVCEAVGALLKCDTSEVLPFSTGVIMEHLPVERIVAALPDCIKALSETAWFDAAEAIMTTDTVPKAVSRITRIDGHAVTVTGIAKGSGMIRPDMATMLGFIATDAAVEAGALQAMVEHASQRSFNSITVDGDTSTNDSLVLIATAQSQLAPISSASSEAYIRLCNVVAEVCTVLAQMLIRDAEGATKFITVEVEAGRDEQECRKVAYAIAHSPLVKTAFFASDPNLGRILAAIGYAGVADLEVEAVELYLGDLLVSINGGRAPGYKEEDGQAVMDQQEITIRVRLNRGTAKATVWTSDLSHDYVSINADYRS